MATPMTADEFLRQLQKWGVPYRETSGWRTRNRNSVGSWGPIHGAGLHHTGDDAPDTADERVLTQGRSDLPPPLCHWGMDDDGVVVLIGWGRANHFGSGAKNVLDAVLAENYGDYPPKPAVDSVDGNQHFYGQETMYSGLHEMTAEAYRSTVLTFAAVCDFHGWSSKSCIGHKEWTSRKVDPGHLDMADFRRDITTVLAAGPTTTGGDMALTADDKTAIATIVLQQIRAGLRDLVTHDEQADDDLKSVDVLRAAVVAAQHSYDAMKGVQSISGVLSALKLVERLDAVQAAVKALPGQIVAPPIDVTALAAALGPLLQNSNLDEDAVAQKVADVLSQRLAP